MDQASALAIWSACAFRHESGSVVQTPLRPLDSDCTGYGSGTLADATTTSLLEELVELGGGPTQQDVATALQELIATMVAMAERAAPPSYYLFSLDPGLGKTMMLVHFLQHLVGS